MSKGLRNKMAREGRPLSWDPVRRGARGEVYCSPACGMDCTWESYQEAKRRGEALARRMGAGWRSVVHENLGWYCSARYKESGVHVRRHSYRPGRPATYVAFVGDAYPAGIWVGDGGSPEVALVVALEKARASLERCREAVEIAAEAKKGGKARARARARARGGK